MGAINFIETGEGRSAREVYDRLVAEAIRYHGNDDYNGTISTCELGRKRLSFDIFKKSNEEKALKFIEDDDYGKKWIADYIDLGVIRYEVYTFKKKNTGNKPKYKMMYTVNQLSGFEFKTIKAFETKKEADDYAVSLAIKYPNANFVVEKEYVLTKGNSITTEIIREVKTYKKKPKLEPMPNRVIVPIHKFMFYGWASI